MMKSVKCKQCKKEFKVHNCRETMFCSRACRHEHEKGITKKCKVCGKEIYVVRSKIKEKKYCCRNCAVKDNFGFVGKEKICVICGKKFVYTAGFNAHQKTCSIECRKELVRINSIKSGIRLRNTILNRVCPVCNSGIKTSKFHHNKYCSYGCRVKFLSESRKGKKNPYYKDGKQASKTPRRERKIYGTKHTNACAKYKRHFLKKHDYYFCESCGVNANGTIRFESHHIQQASRFPSHKHLHDMRNIILLCVQCHRDFHASRRKDEYNELVEERGLNKLFNGG